MSLFFTGKLQTKVDIKSHQLNENIDDLLLDIIKNKNGNKCAKEGYIKKDTIEILKKSNGLIPAGHFNGSIRYIIKYSAQVCNPENGSIIECRVINKNKIGILAETLESPSPLTILVATQHHMNNDNYQAIEVGAIIFVEVIGKKYELYDKKISIISRFTNKNQQTIANGKEKHINKKEIIENLEKKHGPDIKNLSEKEINNIVKNDIQETSLVQGTFPDDFDSDSDGIYSSDED